MNAKAPRVRGGANTHCCICGHITLVVATRLSKMDRLVYRERKCNRKRCGFRFWTCEALVPEGEEPADVRSRPESNRGARRLAGKN